MKRFHISPIALLSALLFALGFALPSYAAPVNFAREIQPIFQAKCLSCHSENKQRGGFRLDRKADALRGGDNIAPAIKPGDAAGSALLKIVSGQMPDLVMPPQGEKLSAAQIALLKRWIDEGAPWPDDKAGNEDRAKTHWAFQTLTRPAVPPGDAQNPIDRFIAAKLRAKQLKLSPEADRRTLLRRAYFSLVGLPPSPEEIESFVADKNPQAYENLVDKLLASPRYGERWARHWLDVVRFAESHGFEMNRPRDNAWPYRDYVIKAFNDDKPYDRFLIEQIAGDQLGADAATGFLVGGPWDQVKSPDPVLTAQQRADELNDMVATTGSAFLGLTVGCARCHAHKFDPISQSDYYRVKACYEGVRHGERTMRPADYEARQSKIAEQRRAIAALDEKLELFRPQARLGQRLLLDDKATNTQQLETPTSNAAIEYSPGTERGQFNDAGDAARLPNLGFHYRYWNAKPGEARDFFVWKPRLNGRFRVWLSWGAWTTHAADARYILDRDGDVKTQADQTEIAVINQAQFADGAPAIANQKRWSGFKLAGEFDLSETAGIVLRGGEKGGPTVADALFFEEVNQEDEGEILSFPHLRAPATHRANSETFAPVEARFLRFTITATSNEEPCLDELEVFADGRNVAAASNGGLATASGTLPGYAIHQLQHINDGKYGNKWSWISNTRGGGWVQIEFAKNEHISRVVWSRDRDDSPNERHFDDRLATGYVIEVSGDGTTWRKVASSADRLPDELRKRVPEIRTLRASAAQMPEVSRLAAQRAELQMAIADNETSPLVYAGQFEQPGATFRLQRGDPMQPREAVVAGGLSTFGAAWELPAAAPEAARRMALAKWIADPKNPLTARVMVNRLWQYNFGAGLVETPSDFGLNGAVPSHPELLDWLASEFIARGWSIKNMQRLIVTSAAFRQSSAPDAGGLATDSAARFLWRYPPRRVEAEPLRDAILQVSGKLDLQMGGPGFDLFAPNDNYVKIYKTKQEFGPDTFRRMVYQAKPRMQLDDTFGNFDCPDAGQIAPRRNRSTTPLQALALLNNPFLMQQSQFFAERLLREAGADAAAQVRRAFALSFGRAPTKDEETASATFIQHHGLVAFCRALFNANEFLYVF